MDTAMNIGLLVTGATAIWLVGSKSRWRNWGYLVGFISQFFWAWAAAKAASWGMILLVFWYAYAWLLGMKNYWIPELKKGRQ